MGRSVSMKSSGGAGAGGGGGGAGDSGGKWESPRDRLVKIQSAVSGVTQVRLSA